MDFHINRPFFVIHFFQMSVRKPGSVAFYGLSDHSANGPLFIYCVCHILIGLIDAS